MIEKVANTLLWFALYSHTHFIHFHEQDDQK